MVASKHWSEIYSTFMLFLTRALIEENYKDILLVCKLQFRLCNYVQSGILLLHVLWTILDHDC